METVALSCCFGRSTKNHVSRVTHDDVPKYNAYLEVQEEEILEATLSDNDIRG
jgi:hypothetical protein